MPFQPQRFMHAANVRLDVPVSVYLSEQLTDELRHQLEDATLLSFDCVVDSCIQRRVDYLLLSGNVFVESDRSLRARLTLLKGFRRLQEKGIPVFVLPGDTDPAEAWRAIPELPDNVHLCLSSSLEPVALERNQRTIATVSASMWYGETDAFGIRVIHSSPDGIEPFRIGTVSRAKYEESQRMASLTTSAADNLLNLDDSSETTETADSRTPDSAQPESEQPVEDHEAGFRAYMQKLMTEGRLNYLALGSELNRTDILLEGGVVHCPGTTQPRSQLEADCGLCSLVAVDAEGRTTSEPINTSAVDWKNIGLDLEPGIDLPGLLERMRDVLLETTGSPSDRIWSVCWTLTGPLPVLQSFIEDDLELAVTVELDAMEVEGRSIRLLHQVRLLPDAWDLDEPLHLAQQYAELIPADTDGYREHLLACLEGTELSEGWSKRLEALADGIDPRRLLAQLRNDGADWFVSDLNELLPPEPEPEPVETEDVEAEETGQHPEAADLMAESDSPSAETEEDAEAVSVSVSLTTDDETESESTEPVPGA